jgi:hypothetical protein
MMRVPSYVLPTDVAALIGDGDSCVGYAALNAIFHGYALHTSNPRIIPPEIIAMIGHGDINAGRKVLRTFIALTREKNKRIRNAAA